MLLQSRHAVRPPTRLTFCIADPVAVSTPVLRQPSCQQTDRVYVTDDLGLVLVCRVAPVQSQVLAHECPKMQECHPHFCPVSCRKCQWDPGVPPATASALQLHVELPQIKRENEPALLSFVPLTALWDLPGLGSLPFSPTPFDPFECCGEPFVCVLSRAQFELRRFQMRKANGLWLCGCSSLPLPLALLLTNFVCLSQFCCCRSLA